MEVRKMLVQLDFNPIKESFNDYIGTAFCQKCGKEIGKLDNGELRYLLVNNWKDVICFNCEDTPLPTYERMGSVMTKKLVELFAVDTISNIPTSGNSAWLGDLATSFLALIPISGWCLWVKEIGQNWTLVKVNMSYKEANNMRKTFKMWPVKMEIKNSKKRGG